MEIYWNHLPLIDLITYSCLDVHFSMVALPILLKDTQEKLGVDSRVANFALPIFTAINRDGSGLFICVSAVFIAQTYGISLTFGQYLVLG